MKKSAQLVCQHLENISRAALKKYQAIIKQYVRRRHGVYALYRRDSLYYVGLASNLRSRLEHHLRDKHKDSWDRFSVYLTIGDSHLKELETLILRIVKPKGNQVQGNFYRSENMRRHLAADLKKLQKLELQLLLGTETHLPNKPKPEKHGGKVPVLAKFVKGPMILRARFKGKRLQARVRSTGEVYFAGKVYNSPSVAAARACGRISCNGWMFWEYERSGGEWVQLDELRK